MSRPRITSHQAAVLARVAAAHRRGAVAVAAQHRAWHPPATHAIGNAAALAHLAAKGRLTIVEADTLGGTTYALPEADAPEVAR